MTDDEKEKLETKLRAAILRELCAELNAENKKLRRKLDMAMEDLKQTCDACKYTDVNAREEPCVSCRENNYLLWQWRGDEDV